MKHPVKLLLVGVLSLGMAAEAFAAYGVSDGDPKVGEWNSSFTKCKAKADAEGIPLVLLASSSGCSYCNTFNTSVFQNSAFQTWCSQQPYLFCKVQAVLGNWSGGEKAAILAFVGGGALPRFAVYWNRANYDGGGVVGANKSKTIQAAGHEYQWYINYITSNFAGYSPAGGDDPEDPTPVVTTYKGGTFTSGTTADTCLQAEPTTTYVDVPMTREATDAVSQKLQIAQTGQDTATVTISWAAGEKSKTYKLEDMGTRYAAGSTITLKLLDDKDEVKSTATITCVAEQANSPLNPYWIGEKTADELEWGDWTMDLDVAKAKVAANSAQMTAYLVVLISGSLWCPDCDKTDSNLFKQQEFKDWAKRNHVVFGVVDLPPYPQDATSTPSLLDYRSGASYFGSSTKSGAGYLSRKMADANTVATVVARNKKLAGNDSRNGGYNSPDRIESGAAKQMGRPGVPILVLLRGDGTVAGRIIEFASKSPTAYNANYLTRLDELLSQIGDTDEELNDYRWTTNQTLAKKGTVSATLSHADAADVYKVPNGSRISFVVSGQDAAQVKFELVQVGTRGETTLAESTGTVNADLISAVYAIPASGNFYAKVSATGNWFTSTKAGSTVCSYTLTTDYVVTPTEAAQTETVPAGTTNITFDIKKDVTYRITGVDRTFSLNGYLVHSSGDLYVGYADAAVPVPIANGTTSVTYQIWKTGRIGFASESDNVAEAAGKYTLKVVRADGTAGSGAVKIEVDKAASTQLSGIYEFADGATHVWADGTSGTWEVPVTIIDNAFADGDQKIVFKLSKLETSDVGLSDKATFTLTVRENDRAAVGKLSISQTEPAKVGTSPIYAKEGTTVAISLARTGGADGEVGCTLTANGGTFDKTSFKWGSRDTSVQVATYTVPAYTSPNQRYTVTLTPNKGVTAVANAKSVVIQVVSANAPSFVKASESYDLVRHVEIGGDMKIAVKAPGSGAVKITKASGAIPAGIKFAYGNGSLVFSGAPTAAGSRTAVFRVMQGTVQGETVAVTFNVKDATKASGGEAALNPSVLKSRTFSDMTVINATLRQMIGKLTVTVPPTGRVSARYSSDAGVVSLSAKNWSAVGEDGALTADAVGTPAKNAGYTLTVTALKNGNVEYSFYDPAWPEGDEIRILPNTAGWSRTKPATRWQGYYTVSLPQADAESKAAAFAKGDGYLTLKMEAAAVNAGRVTYAGMLPSGKPLSGTAVLQPVHDDALGVDTEAMLPIFMQSSTDAAMGVLSIKPDAAKKHGTERRSVYPYDDILFRWVNKEGALAGKTYVSPLGVYGGYYSPGEDFAGCCMETFETTALTFFASPGGLVHPSDGSEAVWSAADTAVAVGDNNAIGLVSPANAQRLSFTFNKMTGIVSGVFNLGYANGSSVRATYKAIVLPGWGTASCVICNPGASETSDRPFISGAAWFSEKLTYDVNNRSRSINVKRGCPVSVGLEEGK